MVGCVQVLKIWEEMEMPPPWGGVSGGLDIDCSGPGRRWRCPPWGGVKCIAADERGLTGKAQQAKARPRSTKTAKKGSWKAGG